MALKLPRTGNGHAAGAVRDTAPLSLMGAARPVARPRTARLRVAVVHGVGFFYSGGGEKLVIQQVLGLRERGHTVDCFAPIVDPRRSFPGWLEEVAARRLAPRLPSWLRYPDALAIISMSLAAPRLARQLASYDVILAANQPAPWVAWWAKKLSGVPYVVYLAQPNRMLHQREIDRERTIIVKRDYTLLRALAPLSRPLVSWADQVSVAEADVALGNGAYMSEVLEDAYGRSFESCPAGATVVRGDACRESGEIALNGALIYKPFVLLTNRHYPQKRFEVAIRALHHRELAARGTQLVITGAETSYTDHIRALARSEGLADRVVFLGLTPEADLGRLYGAAACYVYPSPEEDYGMGAVEAMAAGTPVVAWNAAGPTGTIVDGLTGYLVEPNDEAAFAQRIAELVADEAHASRMGRAAQLHARRHFTLERHVESLEEALLRTAKPQVRR